MNKLKITLTAALFFCGTAVFAGTPKTDAKTDTKTPSVTKVEGVSDNSNAEASNSTKEEDGYIWFDANTGEQINQDPKLESGCQLPGSLCAKGYTTDRVTTPGQEPNDGQPADQQSFGVRP